MSGKIALSEGTEEFKAIKVEWQAKAKAATIETLPAFLTELTEKYQHDYGTICHAVAIAAVAAAWSVDHSPTGGITGFQAGCIMWQFIREWNCSSNKTGMRLLDYDNFLYPQYADKFRKVLSADTWEAIQKEAQAHIEKADKEYGEYLEAVKQYKDDITAFMAKHPDYYERREHYDPLGMGNGEQWEAEEKKKASGFEFAPQEPYCPVNSSSPVYRHWKSILMGKVPFGYTVESAGLKGGGE
jgi:hypothetical protein